MRKIKLPYMEPEQVADEIGNFIVERVLKAKGTGSVIGLSGGVDSTTVAALAKRGFDRFNSKKPSQGLELVGYMLPSNTNGQADKEDGEKVARKLGIRYEIINIEPIVEAHKFTNPEALENVYDKGNLMSRVRANVLSTKAATEHKILLGTGNKDEDFGIGYYTLFGDGAVHISPIGGLSKRLVRQMSEYLGFLEIANREPAAGLEPGQTDFKDLGYGYDAVEIVLEGLYQGIPREELYRYEQVTSIIQPQLQRSKFKTIEEVVSNILYRHDNISSFKSEIIHPPIAPVTLTYKEAA
jgi:NAD+ synthase